MTVALSTLCLILRVLYEFTAPMHQRLLIEGAGVNPARFSKALSESGPWLTASEWASAVVALFIHASWLHLFGNVAYLWVFGLPVERRLGAAFLLLVFLLGGVLAHVSVALQMPGADTAVIGASGAVSAVVGTYLGLFPGRSIGLYLPLGLFVQFVRVPALLVIGSWFTLQLLYSAIGPISGAMAWWTHLAGFVVGLILALLARALAQLGKH